MKEFLNKLFGGKDYPWEVVGSTAILGAGEDYDVAIRVPVGDEEYSINCLRMNGWNVQGHGYRQIEKGNNFLSGKKDDINILLCFDETAWNRFVKGRDMCIFLKSIGVDFTDKKVRIAIHALTAGEDINGVMKDVNRIR